MATRLSVILCSLFFLCPLAVRAQDPAQDFVRLYYDLSLQQPPLIHDLCKAFVDTSSQHDNRGTGINAFYWVPDERYGSLFLGIGLDDIHGIKLEMTGANQTGHTAPEAHEGMEAPASHGGTETSGTVYIIQPAPTP
ncbi:MAG: hypothetical protein JEZ02_12145 [Desulfatibacillum sp.]|nr:hypothetical protein [Desulfatibacillum sp.]